MKRHFVTCALFGTLAFTASSGVATDGPPYSLTVKRSHLLRSSPGTLRIAGDGIEYNTLWDRVNPPAPGVTTPGGQPPSEYPFVDNRE